MSTASRITLSLRKKMLRLSVSALALALLTASSQGLYLPAEWRCTVKYIVDGDTFDCNDMRIRPRCVEAPERGEQGYHLAKSDATSLTMGKVVTVSGPYRRSRNRFVATVTLPDGRVYSDVMQSRGWAAFNDPLCG